MPTEAQQTHTSGGAADATPDAGTRVLHGQSYHVAIARALYEAQKLDAHAILAGPAAEIAHAGLLQVRDGGESACLGAAEEGFRAAGLGRLDLSETGPGGGTASLADSLVALGWRARHGRSAHPVCATAAGAIAGAMEAAFGRPFAVEEVECAAQGASVGRCRFRVRPAEEGFVPVEPRPREAAPRQPAAPPPPPGPGAEIAESLFPAPPGADEGGRIDGPGGRFARVRADYYPRVAQRFEREVPRAMGAKFANIPALLLTEAAHYHGFYGLGEVMRSAEWTVRARASLTTREELMHAAVALVNRLGWGVWHVHSLVPGEQAAVRVYESHEALAHRVLYGRAAAPRCFLARGTAAALMNLVFVGDLPGRPALTPSYYNQLFRSPLSFRAVETRCRAMDDPYCEFVINPLSASAGVRLREALG
ncbi:MAG TPA: V4R domain-containing protein [Longimicrobiaceae bacterium]|nr:V4R domain-containing protein [Longimicrobiaceae bacterium]